MSSLGGVKEISDNVSSSADNQCMNMKMEVSGLLFNFIDLPENVV